MLWAALLVAAPFTRSHRLSRWTPRCSPPPIIPLRCRPRRRRCASAEAAVKAGQLPDPMLKAGIDNLPVNGGQRFTVGWTS